MTALRTVLLAALAVVCAPRPAGACSCVGGQALEVSPGHVAPRNPVIRIRWIAHDDPPDPFGFELRPSPRDGTVFGPVEVTHRVITIGEITVVELRPTAALDPRIYYDVYGAAGRYQTFRTSDQLDDTAPTWTGVSKTTYVDGPAVCCNCSTGDPWAVFELDGWSAITDDQTSADLLVYGIWPDTGAFDPTAPPLAMVSAWQGYVMVGHSSLCSPNDFDFEKAARAAAQKAPAKKRKKKKGKKKRGKKAAAAALPEGAIPLYLAPIDDAGNVGAPARVVIDRSKPVTEFW